MKKTLLILSLLLLTSCNEKIPPWPVRWLYFTDLRNKICAAYEIVDPVQLKWELRAEYALEPGGPCDALAGFSRDEFAQAKNWIRDAIKAGENCK